MVMKNVKVIKNPVICQSLCTMRNKNTDSQGVRIAARKIILQKKLEIDYLSSYSL